MFCITSCGISLVLIISTIYFTLMVDKHSTIKSFTDTLDETQKKIYDKIVEERKSLAIQGYAFGLVLSLLAIYLNLSMRYNINVIAVACTTAMVTLITQTLYYILSPKTDWIVNHLETEDQKKAWVECYRTMQKGYHTGLAVGIVSVAALSYSYRY
jgi:hypothetical protein